MKPPEEVVRKEEKLAECGTGLGISKGRELWAGEPGSYLVSLPVVFLFFCLGEK